MALPLLAIPVLHSSGGFIAYGTGGYLAGTLSTTWAGAFVAANGAVLAGMGAAGAAIGTAWASVAGATTAAAGSAAVALGLAPATFLGLTPVGWAIAGGVAATGAATGAGLYYYSRPVREAIDGVLPEINEERVKAGLEPFKNSWEAVKEIFVEMSKYRVTVEKKED